MRIFPGLSLKNMKKLISSSWALGRTVRIRITSFRIEFLDWEIMVVVDIGGSLQSGYHSDCTRTYVVGGPGAVSRMYQVLYDAQAAAVRTVRPG